MSLPTHLQVAINQKFGRRNVPKIKVGETIRVHQQIVEGKKSRVQVFEGIVIAVKHGLGLNGSYTVRRIAAGGVGVEKTFPVHLPSIVKIEQVKKAKVRRAKLYYMRERFGKRARFANEVMTGHSWQEELDEEVGEMAEENKPAEEPKEEKVEKEEKPKEEKPEEEKSKETEPKGEEAKAE